ncbi:MAG: chemotaxis protein CheW [Moraxella sp.]|nr:MAG: chemotaxis protein CheW [Moraxella sp.]
MASVGFIELLRLADLAKARTTGRHDNDTHQWTGIAFEVAGQKLVAPMGEISEILALPDVVPIPLTKPWLMGVANVRGRLLPLVDFAKFLGLQSHERLKNRKVLVIDEEGIFSGILVDQVLGILQFSESHYQARAINEDSPFAPYNHGVFVKDNKEWFVMMPSLLCASADYLNAAAS